MVSNDDLAVAHALIFNCGFREENIVWLGGGGGGIQLTSY